MASVKVTYKFMKTAPRKVRLVADLIRGKKTSWAIDQLRFLNKAASKPVKTLVVSAVAAAKDKDLNEDALYITEIKVDEGPRLKRRRANSRGRASGIAKRMSHLAITVSDVQPKAKKEKKINKKVEKQIKKDANQGSENGSKSKSN